MDNDRNGDSSAGDEEAAKQEEPVKHEWTEVDPEALSPIVLSDGRTVYVANIEILLVYDNQEGGLEAFESDLRNAEIECGRVVSDDESAYAFVSRYRRWVKKRRDGTTTLTFAEDWAQSREHAVPSPEARSEPSLPAAVEDQAKPHQPARGRPRGLVEKWSPEMASLAKNLYEETRKSFDEIASELNQAARAKDPRAPSFTPGGVKSKRRRERWRRRI